MGVTINKKSTTTEPQKIIRACWVWSGSKLFERLSADDTSSRWLGQKWVLKKEISIFLLSSECRYETTHARIFTITFLSALIWVQTVCKGCRSADDTTDDCGHKWALKKKKHYTFFSSSEDLWANSRNNTHCYKITNKKRAPDWTEMSFENVI